MVNSTSLMVARSCIKACGVCPKGHMEALNALFGDPHERGHAVESLLYLARDLALSAYAVEDSAMQTASQFALQKRIESAIEALTKAFEAATDPEADYD